MQIGTQRTHPRFGFSLVELMVVIAIIGILSAIVYANFSTSRKIARDDQRKTDLKNMQVAIELYKAHNGKYPAMGCGPTNEWAGANPASATWANQCADYIVGLVPDYIAALPIDPRYNTVNDTDMGYYYRSNGTDYKLAATRTVEILRINDFTDEFARCPALVPAVPPATTSYCDPKPDTNLYAVYSAGAKNW